MLFNRNKRKSKLFYLLFEYALHYIIFYKNKSSWNKIIQNFDKNLKQNKKFFFNLFEH